MIMAYDAGAWHPPALALLLWLVVAIASLVPVYRLVARAPGRRRFRYMAAAIPFVGFFFYVAYFDYGNSGAYIGYRGEMGPGAHVDLIASLDHTLSYAVLFAPTPALVALASWGWLRKPIPPLFWAFVVILIVLQTLFYFGVLFTWFER